MADKVSYVANQPNFLLVECPACDMAHGVNLDPTNGKPCWTWNGDKEKPTFHPSLLVTYPWGPERKEVVCHSFVRNGQWHYLNDCTHSMAGRVVDLPDAD